jgi:nucleoside-diphosphate kinase
MNETMTEQTLSIIKPDAVERNLENKIKSFYENNNLKILKSKKVQISKQEAEEFYKIHQTKPFYNKLCNYLSSGPIIVMILEGENSISKNREIMGATDPLKAKEGTLRKIYGVSIDKNSVHGSDSLDNATKEINFFFNK